MEYNSNWSDGQYMTLVLVLTVSCFLSLLGSIAVTRISYLKLTSTYQRFLFMLSVADVINSFFLMIHSWLVPRSADFFWAFGNQPTCTTVGFFAHFGALSVAMYNCYLSVYFYCSIQSSPKREKLPEDIIGIWEWFAHMSCIIVPGAIAGTAAATDSINLAKGIGLCLIQSYQCEGASSPLNEDCLPLGRNGWKVPTSTFVVSWIFLSTLMVVSLWGITATLMVFLRVKSTLRQGAEAGNERVLSEEMKQRLRAVSTQSILYSSVFVCTFLWPTLAVLTPSFSGGASPPFVLHFLAFLLYPIHGVWNCLIYIRPRYQMLRAMYPDDSIMVVFRVSMSKAGDPEEIEEVRERIYGDDYEVPSGGSSAESVASDIPPEVAFDPRKPLSDTSMVSVPDENDEMDPEEVKSKSHHEHSDSNMDEDDFKSN